MKMSPALARDWKRGQALRRAMVRELHQRCTCGEGCKRPFNPRLSWWLRPYSAIIEHLPRVTLN